MYLKRGETSMSAAELRIAAYSRSCSRSYELATTWPAQRRQAWPSESAAVRAWNGVVLSISELPVPGCRVCVTGQPRPGEAREPALGPARAGVARLGRRR